MIVGTDTSELLIIDSSDLKTTLHLPVAKEKATVISSLGKVIFSIPCQLIIWKTCM